MKPPHDPNPNGNAPHHSSAPAPEDSFLATVDGGSLQKRDPETVAPDGTELQTEQVDKVNKTAPVEEKPQKTAKQAKAPSYHYSRFNWGTFLKNRRLELTALVISLLVCNFFALHVWNFESRFDKVRQTPPFLPLWKQLETVELALYDARFTNRGPRLPNSLNDIAIVGLDQASLTAFRTWPIPRSWHAQLIRRLKKAGAKVIVFDIGFSDRQDLIEDAELAKAMAEAKNVILPSLDASQLSDKYAQDEERTLNIFDSPLTASDYDEWWQLNKDARRDPKMQAAYQTFRELGLDEQTPDLAIATVNADLDGATRRYNFRADYHDATVHVGGLAVLAVALYQGGLLDGNKNEAYETALKNAVMPTLNDRMAQVPLRLNAPTHPDAPIYYSTPIYFWGPAQTFPTYSYKEVKGIEIIGGDGKPQIRGYSDSEMRKRFKDKLVFIGATAPILKDIFPLPNFKTQDAKQKVIYSQQISGVELHASVAAMMLDGEYIRIVKPQTTLVILYLTTLFAGLWTAILRGWVNSLSRVAQSRARKIGLRISLHAIIWFSLYAFLLVPPLFGFWEAAKWFFEAQNLWVVVVYPLGSAITASIMVLLMLYGAESVERRKTIAQLGAYVAPEVRDEILAQAEGEYVRPRRVEATMLFTDLEGFTSYSETHDPEDVVEALNDYFDRMVRIIRTHGGGTDKFIGDAVMAFFGVPVPRYDHASQAVLCAIAMQEECARFREETGIEFYMRIGIHSGEMIAGSIGATKAGFLNYTTIGDTVNLASRLEGKNKEFGSWIMVSASTFEAARDLVEGESAHAQIKGKAQGVEVYIVHGLKGHREQSSNWGHQLEAPSSGAFTEQQENIAFGDQRDIRALPAPEEISEGKSL